MADASDIPAWITLYFGLYALGASIGEIVRPGMWAEMVQDFIIHSGLLFLAGIVCIGLGGLVYLANPWNGDDWLSVLVTILGGGMAIEGFLMLAFGPAFMKFAQGLLGTVSRGWALFSGLVGLGFIVVALGRL
jgi:hypothetical protein